MSDKKITELPLASAVNASDVSVLVNNGSDYQFAFSSLLQLIGSSLTVGANITFGTTLPQNTAGKNGDVFINTTTASFAQKISGAWTLAYTLPASGGTTDGTVLYGIGVPSSLTGNNNDTYINTGTGVFYKKITGVWNQVFSMQTGPAGAPGAPGANGINGTNGFSILSGTTNPSNISTGVNGDFYINTTTYILFGPKTAENWGTGTSLIGNGVPIGGTSGQVMSKVSDDNFDIEWSDKFTGLNDYNVMDALGYTPEDISNKGTPNGYAGLDESGKVPSSQLPSYVDDVIEVTNYAALPTTGETGKIYITIDTHFEYRWSGSTYIRLVASPGTTDAIAEGTINKYYTDARVAAYVGANNISGTVNYLPKFTGASAVGNSLIFDDGSKVGLGTNTPLTFFHVDSGSVIPFRISTTNDEVAQFISSNAYGGFRVAVTGAAAAPGGGTPYIALNTGATSNGSSLGTQRAFFAYNLNTANIASLGYGNSSDAISYLTSGANAGFVGIGNNAPTEKLHVNGGTKANYFTGNYYYIDGIGASAGSTNAISGNSGGDIFINAYHSGGAQKINFTLGGTNIFNIGSTAITSNVDFNISKSNATAPVGIIITNAATPYSLKLLQGGSSGLNAYGATIESGFGITFNTTVSGEYRFQNMGTALVTIGNSGSMNVASGIFAEGITLRNSGLTLKNNTYILGTNVAGTSSYPFLKFNATEQWELGDTAHPLWFMAEPEIKSGNGIIMTSPDSTRYRVKVANGGTISVTSV